VRQGIVSLLQEEPNFNVVIEAENGSDLLQQMKDKSVRVVLLDLDMPILNGQQALAVINDKYPLARVIIVSMHYSENFITECIKSCARGFLPKNVDIENVVEAIKAVTTQGYYFNESVSKDFIHKILQNKMVKPKFKKEELSDREKEIVVEICKGLKSQDIAEKLFISRKTVESHRTRIFEKSNATNVAGVVIYAIKKGIYHIS
jgi:DNA-binding NarL/FixJ family response regulator